MPSHLLGVMQFVGVVLGLVASCALLPGHNRVKAPSTLSASPAVIMVATAAPEPRVSTSIVITPFAATAVAVGYTTW